MTGLHSPFGFASTADEVSIGVDLTGRRALVTGGASGIGVETARVLAARGAAVTIAVRDLSAGQRVATEIAVPGTEPGAPGSVVVAPLDLSELVSVRALVEAWTGPLDILVANAGVMATPPTWTTDGWELQLATNHLGHAALVTGLHPALAAAPAARVVMVSSSAHLISPVIFDDLHFRFRPYDPGLAYGQSKTANVLFAVGAAKRWAGDGIVVNALMPGAIPTRLQRHVPGDSPPPGGGKTVAQGAATSVMLAASPIVEGLTGRYFADCDEAELVDHLPADPLTAMRSVAPYALDLANADRLWAVTEELLAEGGWAARSAVHPLP